MKNILKRLIVFSEMHSFQVIALVGFIMSVIAHILLTASGKTITSFSFLYPTWGILFLIGFFINLASGPGQSNHH